MHVLFLEKFDWSPAEFNGRVTIQYKAGCEYSVKHDCGLAAIAASKAVGLDAPDRVTKAAGKNQRTKK